jgi:hypothetical protein
MKSGESVPKRTRWSVQLWILLLDMVDNSTSPDELISGSFSPYSTVQASRCIL